MLDRVLFRSRVLLGVALAALASSAGARDYIVVASTDPAIARGATYDAGTRLTLASGAKVTLMHASGGVLALRGARGGVVLPRREVVSADAGRLAILKVIVSPAERRVVGGGRLARTRGGICPGPESLVTLDDIAAAAAANCAEPAQTALAAYLEHAPPLEP
jgi:hypothetical protein